jgi:hypothetical protein
MLTSCPRCEGTGCAYCHGIGQKDYAEYEVGYDRELRKLFKEIIKLKILLSRAQKFISNGDVCCNSGYALENKALQTLMDDITTAISWK